MNHIDTLNKRLADSLGYVGDLPRFAWHWAPSQARLVYDTDDRTLLRKTWADAPAPDGGVIGRAWVLAERRFGKAEDHCGFGEGIRVAATGALEYFPFYETSVITAPTDELNANYIWALRYQLENTFEDYVAEEKYSKDRNLERDRKFNIDRSAAIYDQSCGAFGNLSPGQVDGWMSWGGTGDSPMVKKLQDGVAA